MNTALVPADVEQYFEGLAPDKRAIIHPVFEVVREAMPAGYSLGMGGACPAG